MISVYDTIMIPLFVCLCVSLFIKMSYNEYWKNHKIQIFGAMATATFAWATCMNNLLGFVVIAVFVITMVMATSVCDALYTIHKRKERRNVEVHEEEA